MKKEWFHESLFPTVSLGVKVKKIIASQKSDFQNIQILDTDAFGRMLVLDGVIQTTQQDEFIYHEMISHLPLLAHPSPERVLIIGGGDGGVLREVLKHPVKEVYLVEIDKKVIDLSRIYLKSICRDSFSDNRVNIIIDDGAKFVKKEKRKFNVIIIDSSDPIGPAKVLFSPRFYRRTFELLTEDGILIQQTGSSFLQPKELPSVVKELRKVFPFVNPYLISVPTYIGGFFCLVFASKKINPGEVQVEEIEKRYREIDLKTRYYNPQIHVASFALPNYIEEAVKKEKYRRWEQEKSTV